MTPIRLDAIVFDGGTQIRAAIDAQTVTDYADAMAEGAQFPAIVLFHDGTQHYLADGFHRYLAAQRVNWHEIDAEVKAGTKEDALWFALGANRTNGKRLTDADKTHAIAVARQAWPDKMQCEIAEQVGCHPSLVSRVYQKLNSSEPVSTGRTKKTNDKREQIRELLVAGQSNTEIAKKVGSSLSRVSEIRVELGMSRGINKSRGAIQQRRDRMREMAGEGFTSRQMAAELGLSEEVCRVTLRKEGINVPADAVTHKTKRHDANRIIKAIVADAENLTEGVDLIDFSALDRAQLPEWVRSLQQSRDKFGSFIRRLMKERQHGEAA